MGKLSSPARRAVAVGAAVAAVAALTAGAVPGRAQTAPASGPDPELGELIAGTSAYVGGTHVWTDYAYDDTGANADLIDGGDATYPGAPHPGNTADLVQLQLGTTPAGDLRVAAVLNTLVDGHDALLGVGFDTDRDPSTGAPSLPGGRWDNSRPLGLEHLVLLPTDGPGRLLSWDGEALVDRGAFDVRVDRARNLLEATIGALRPGTSPWRTVGVVGPIEAGGSWLDGAEDIFDLAYVRGEDPSMEVLTSLPEQVPQAGFVPYQDKVQADVLAGRLPPERAVAEVRFGTGWDVPATPVVGFNTFLYHSRVVLPGGVLRDDAGQPVEYRGRYQPYGVLLREGLADRPPVVVFLHGANQYQNVNPVHFSPTGLVLAGAYDVPAAVIFPNGRTTGWGTALAEQDALDATDDAVARLRADPDRVVLSGVSSGGMGTFRLAARYPDRWAGGFSIVGGTQSDTPLENLTNVPFRATNGLLDPLVTVQTWRAAAEALDAAGTVDHRIVLVHNRSHDGPIAEGNCFFLDLLARPVDRSPGRVRFTVVPRSFVVDPERNLDQRPRGAYWISALASRDDEPASVDAESLARPGREVAAEIDEHQQNLLETRDFCGPHPTMRNATVWSTQGRAFAPVARGAANELTLELTNLAAATVDVAGAGLRTDAPLTITVTGDGPGQVVLAGAWQGRQRLLRDGVEVAAGVPRDGRVVLDGDHSGTHTWVVSR